MRDPNRLDEFYDTLKTIHKEIFPDLRFMQFIENFQRWANRDLYYCEDSELRKLLVRYTDEATLGRILFDPNKITLCKKVEFNETL